jgi:hypothetical protein
VVVVVAVNVVVAEAQVALERERGFLLRQKQLTQLASALAALEMDL